MNRKLTSIICSNITDKGSDGGISSRVINSLNIKRDARNGKEVITVTINGDIAFKYDSSSRLKCLHGVSQECYEKQ